MSFSNGIWVLFVGNEKWIGSWVVFRRMGGGASHSSSWYIWLPFWWVFLNQHKYALWSTWSCPTYWLQLYFTPMVANPYNLTQPFCGGLFLNSCITHYLSVFNWLNGFFVIVHVPLIMVYACFLIHSWALCLLLCWSWGLSSHTQLYSIGFFTFLGANAISWCVKKHPTVSLSSAEVEYQALASIAA